MFKNSVKQKIRNGQVALGSWIALSDPYAVEVMAAAGYDWLLIDTEHCPIGTESLRDILIAMKGTSVVPIVRLMGNHPDYFKMALDLGAGGVIVPMVETAEMARRAVEYCRYPPLGKRGCGPVRASNFFRDYDEYMAEANEEILLVVQIETIGSVGELDSILGVEGVDGIFVGPSDLALSMKGMDEAERPTLAETMARIFEKARERGVPYGTLADAPEDCVRYARQGATLLTVGGDLGFIMEGSVSCLKETRSRLP